MFPRLLFIISVLLLTHSFTSKGQSPFDDNFPDTVKPFKPKIFRVLNIDSLKPAYTDTLTNPEGLLFWSHLNDRLDGPYIAIKGKGIYNVFLINYDNETSGWDTVERIDFNGKGSKELLIKYKWNMGNNHFSEYHQGFYLWDLDNITELMSVEYYYSYWLYTVMVIDSTGEYTQADTADHGQQDCYHYEPKVDSKTITFTETAPQCQWDEKAKEKNEKIANPQTIKYLLKDGYLVKAVQK
jgi:hypothetical protein